MMSDLVALESIGTNVKSAAFHRYKF